MKTTLAVLVENRPGVMSRVSGLFRRRGYNIHSISVGPTQEPSVSRMTLVVDGDQRQVEQVKKQLNKIVDVIKVIDLPPENSVERELALIKVKADEKTRSEIMQMVDAFRAHIVDVAMKSITVEITGDEDKVNALIELLARFGIEEVARTGKTAITRGGRGNGQAKMPTRTEATT